MGTIAHSTLPLRVSQYVAPNVLPQFKWMGKKNGGEFEESGYTCVAWPQNFRPNAPRFEGRGACDAWADPMCPDYVFEGLWADGRTKSLPYTIQNNYDRAQAPATVPMLTLANGQLKATVAPQWGGRVWGLETAAGVDLIYKNKYYQPNSDALRQAYTQGGIEWNFGTQIGHMSQTQDPVWTARMPTKRGEVLRLWTFERISRAVWQVDLLLQGDALYSHVTLSPVVDDIDAYWWTNVAINNDIDGQRKVRVLTPATGFVSDDGVAALAPWPYFHERSLGTGARDKASHDGDYLYPDYPALGATPLDHSYPFMWWEKRDVWFELVEGRKVNYNGWADASGTSFIHGHPNNGTKAWIWGTSPNEVYWQRFGSANAHAEPLQPFTYTELQAGVMPTQYQGWPMKRNSTRQWTEVFTTGGASAHMRPSDLMDPDYHGKAIPAVDAWMDGRGIGSQNSSALDEVDAFLAALASTPPKPSDVLTYGEAYGGLEAQRLGVASLTPGTIWPTSTSRRPAYPAGPTPRATKGGPGGRYSLEEVPWAELLLEGTFSAASLRSHPTSFMIADEWVALVRASAASRGKTWLHSYHQAVAALDAIDAPDDAAFNASAALFAESWALKHTAEAARGLAIVASARRDFAGAKAHYEAALALVLPPAADPDPEGGAVFALNLAAEFAQFLYLTAMDDELVKLVARTDLPAAARATCRFRMGEAKAAFVRKDWAGVYHLLDCAAERQWPSLGNDLGTLLGLYKETMLAEATQKKGAPLSDVERARALRARQPPVCLTAVGH